MNQRETYVCLIFKSRSDLRFLCFMKTTFSKGLQFAKQENES